MIGVLTNGAGPTLLIRGDMDALPVTETTGLPYASQVTSRRPDGTSVGVMHACGHDIHTSNLIATAQLLASLPSLPGRRTSMTAEDWAIRRCVASRGPSNTSAA